MKTNKSDNLMVISTASVDHETAGSNWLRPQHVPLALQKGNVDGRYKGKGKTLPQDSRPLRPFINANASPWKTQQTPAIVLYCM